MSACTLRPALRHAHIAVVIAATVSNALLGAGEKSPNDSKAQPSAKDLRGATGMRPVADEAAAKIIIDPPLPDLLARGMALIQFRTENLRLFPMFGPDAQKVSPRLGHLHIRLDDNPWGWAHTSGDDLIVNRLTAGSHKIHIELADANHKILAMNVVQFEVPRGPHEGPLPGDHEIIPDLTSKGQPPAKIFADPPQPEQLARGVALIQCRTENAQVASVFGVAALEVSPRICHLHITVDDARWRWADTSGGPVILAGLPPGPHKVLIELVNANHKPIANSVVKFEVPQSSKEHSDTKAGGKSEQANK